VPAVAAATSREGQRPQLSVVLSLLHLRTIHRAEDIGSALKRGVNVCQQQFVNEVLGPFVTELIRNFGGEDATPIQHAFPTAAFWITSRLIKLVRHIAPQGFWGCLPQSTNWVFTEFPRQLFGVASFFGRAKAALRSAR
jgi:hypothetical protein